jgi:hypothetical protein
VFNPLNFQTGNDTLTLAEANDLYLQLTGGIERGAVIFNAGLTATTIGSDSIVNATSITTDSLIATTTISSDAITATTSISAPNLYISAYNDGVDTEIEILNTANTTNSGAVLRLATGSLGGDPKLEWYNGSGTNYSMGTDMSDSKKLVLSASSTLGTNNLLTFTNTLMTTMLPISSFSGDLVLQRAGSTVLTLGSSNSTFAGSITSNTLTSATATDLVLQRATVPKITIGSALTTFADSIECDTLTSKTATDLTLSRATVAKLVLGNATATFTDSITSDTLTSKSATDLTLSRATTAKLVLGSSTATFTDSITSDTLTSKALTNLTLSRAGSAKLVIGSTTATFTNSITCDTITSKTASDLLLQYNGNTKLTVGISALTPSVQITNTSQPLIIQKNTANQSIANNTTSTVLFPTNVATQNSAITYSAGTFTVANDSIYNGLYLIIARIVYDSSASGNRELHLAINGTNYYGWQILPNTGGLIPINVSIVVPLVANDSLIFKTYQNSGGALNIVGATVQSDCAVYKLS